MSRHTDKDEEREARVRELMDRAQKHQQRAKGREAAAPAKPVSKRIQPKRAKRR